MKKTVLAAIAAAMLVPASAAADPLATTGDPTGGEFSGDYRCGWEQTYDAQTQTWDYTVNADGSYKEVYCHQEGNVSVYEDGVEACNGNPALTNPQDGTPLVGYVWVGPAHTSSNTTAAAPGNVVGAGNNHEDADGNPTGDTPCSSGSSGPPPDTETTRTTTTPPPGA